LPAEVTPASEALSPVVGQDASRAAAVTTKTLANQAGTVTLAYPVHPIDGDLISVQVTVAATVDQGTLYVQGTGTIGVYVDGQRVPGAPTTLDGGGTRTFYVIVRPGQKLTVTIKETDVDLPTTSGELPHIAEDPGPDEPPKVYAWPPKFGQDVGDLSGHSGASSATLHMDPNGLLMFVS
jgi:hypothetical protein